MTSDVRTEITPQIVSPVGAGLAGWRSRRRAATSPFDESQIFPSSQGVPETAHKLGCMRGIMWAVGFQAIAVILAVFASRFLHSSF
jgi:hypothetical protein